jgi:hypothetical protein
MNKIENNELIKQFESLYSNGNYKEAKDLLLLNKDQFALGVFHYNLGTLYLKNQEIPEARFNLELALQNGLQKPSVWKNHEYVMTKVAQNDLAKSGSLVDNILDYSHGLSNGIFLSISLLFLILMTILFKNVTKIKFLFAAFFLLLSLGTLGFKFLCLDKMKFALAQKEIALREGPSEIFQNFGVIPTGSKFVITKENDGWLFVGRPLSLVGWIKIENVLLYK